MAPTIKECACDCLINQAVKEYVRYKLDEFPFTTARKINHTRCFACGGLRNASTNKELIDDMCKNRLFIAEQDKMYSVNDNSPITSLAGRIPATDYTAPHQPKQWQRGYINYLRMVNTGEKVVIIPSSHPYEVYCIDENKLSTAAKQFIKPDDYFKLTSIV